MEDNLIKWQSVWQQQKSKPMQFDEIINRLNKLERKSKTQRIGLLLIFATLMLLAVLQPLEILKDKFNLLAYILLLSAIVVKLMPSLKGKYNLITDEAEFDNLHFVKKLKERMTFNTKYLIIYLFLATLGLNFALLSLYEKGAIFSFEFNSQNRIVIHLFTVLLFIIGYSINKKRLNQSQNEISDLIQDLEIMD